MTDDLYFTQIGLRYKAEVAAMVEMFALEEGVEEALIDITKMPVGDPSKEALVRYYTNLAHGYLIQLEEWLRTIGVPSVELPSFIEALDREAFRLEHFVQAMKSGKADLIQWMKKIAASRQHLKSESKSEPHSRMETDFLHAFENLPLLFNTAIQCKELFAENIELTTTVSPTLTAAVRSGVLRGMSNEALTVFLKSSALYQQTSATLCAFELLTKLIGQILEVLSTSVSPEVLQSVGTLIATQSLDPEMQTIVEDRQQFILHAKQRQAEFEKLIQQFST